MFYSDKFPAKRATAAKLLEAELSMQEQRQFARKTLSCTVSIFNESSGEYVGLMVDYSKNGVMISSAAPLAVNTEFHFRMVDIEPRQNIKRSAKFMATSVWSDKINSTMYGAGFKLLDLSDDAKAMFASYDANPKR